MQQLELIDVEPSPVPALLQLWTAKDMWVHMSQRVLELFKEDRRIERKDHKSANLDDLATYYSMWSNTVDGGIVVYGVTDKGGIVGCNFTDDQINRIERCHIERCPMAQPDFKRVPVVVDGQQRLCLAIFLPYIGRLAETNHGEAYIRYGASRKKMSEEEKRDFRTTRLEPSFELTPAPLFKYPDDFDLRIIRDFCDSFRDREQRTSWTDDDVLIDRHLLKVIDGSKVPLNTLVLMAAKDPSIAVPGCRVRIQRWESTVEGTGTEYSPLRDRTVEGNLVKIIQESREVISSLIYDVTWLDSEGKFVTTPEYPPHAWFEALVNACVHRSYAFSGTEITVKIFQDRMEIESPGGFVPPVSEETIYDVRASRNHHLMEALRYLGYVQMAREGVRRIRDSMKQFNLPEPTFRQEALHGVVVRVTLKNDMATRKRASAKEVATYFGVEVWKKLEEHEIKIAASAFRNGTIQVSEAQRLTGRTWATSKKDLDRLVAKGVLVFEPGSYVRDPKAQYRVVKPADGQK